MRITASFVLLVIAIIFFLMHACGKLDWEFGTVKLYNIGFGLACFAGAFLPGGGCCRRAA